MQYTIQHNSEFNSLEIFFDEKPSEAIRNALKSLKFRWHKIKKCWYGRKSEEEVKAALEGKPLQTTSQKNEVVRNHTAKVGDIFYIMWGYDQTNYDFFRIKELVGKSSAIVQEVSMATIEEEWDNCMSKRAKYDVTKAGIVTRSIFIDDNEKGCLKRIKMNKNGEPYFYIGQGEYLATPYHGGTCHETYYH